MTAWLAKRRAQPSALRSMGCYCLICLYWCSLTWAASIAQVDSVNPPVQLYWNRSNPLFGPDAVIDVQMKDTINLWCPQNTTPASSPEVYVIYRVPQINYVTCTLPSGTVDHLLTINITRVINCSKFYSTLRPQLLITDYPISGPLNGGLTWLPGQTYYLMTASTGDFSGLDNVQPQASACRQSNMRLMVRVDNASVLPPQTSKPPTAPASADTTAATTAAPAQQPPATAAKSTGSTLSFSLGTTVARTAAGSSTSPPVKGSNSPISSVATRVTAATTATTRWHGSLAAVTAVLVSLLRPMAAR